MPGGAWSIAALDARFPLLDARGAFASRSPRASLGPRLVLTERRHAIRPSQRSLFPGLFAAELSKADAIFASDVHCPPPASRLEYWGWPFLE